MALVSTSDKAAWIWIGMAAGAALGVGIALARGRRSRWDSATHVTKRLRAGSGDLADKTRDIVTRVRGIYDESRKVVEEANDLWAHGRKLVRA
jgi:hypothetical protein